ncbi:TniB family NTP-binding protein [Kribbella sp. NPDC051718]|uniref:TniB family NTP-binding protein n=1 Tax=Kribbella sp. NPDC051718 TaxID=3155168 RepID=UPI003427FB0F
MPEVVVEGTDLDLSHLHESVRPIAALPAAERLGYVRADRWIGYPAANEALQRLETLLAWPAKQRMPNLLLVGPTNNGKSMIIEKFRRDHPVVSHADHEEIPVLALQMPSNPSVTRFYTAILTAMGAPLRKTYQIAHLEQVVLQLLRSAGVRMLIIDELHNVFGGTADACSLLASFAAAFPLRRPSLIATPEMTSYLLTRSEGTIGELAGLLTDAASAAIESGEESINQRTLQLASYAGPTERRRLFERELT